LKSDVASANNLLFVIFPKNNKLVAQVKKKKTERIISLTETLEDEINYRLPGVGNILNLAIIKHILNISFYVI
jgi:hypothetical protein